MHANLSKKFFEYAAAHPKKCAFRFLDQDGNEVDIRTYSQLVNRASQVACELQNYDSEYVLLFYTQGINFIESFLGVMISGRVPVPVFAPNAHRDNFSRMTGIVSDSKAKVILTDHEGSKVFASWRNRSENLISLQEINTSLISNTSETIKLSEITEHKLAFLQYTSGSTGTPKGVMVSQENLISNLTLLKEFYQKSEQDIFVSWVPIYHDLGLIGNILFPIFLGAECVFMAPETFVRRPSLWLEAISDYRATISFAPTFAYGFTCNYIKQNGVKSLDLSCWDVCIIGAEPIFEYAMNIFHENFKQYGFHKKIFQAAYGLAESTLMVVATPKGNAIKCCKVDANQLGQGIITYTETNEPSEYRSVVSSGQIGALHEMKIFDTSTGRVLGNREVGEVLLYGPSIAAGYHNTEDNDNYSIQIDNKMFLRTGDAGFIDEGELYITGRIKDVIIINGVNYYPQDIENLIYTVHRDIRTGCAAVFTIDEDVSPKLIIVAEAKGDLVQTCDIIFDKIINQVENIFGLVPYDIVLITPGTIAKTSSGKIQRRLTKKLYLGKKLKTITLFKSDSPSVEAILHLQNWLKFTIAEMLNKPITSINLDTTIHNIGLSSVRLVELITKLSEKLSVSAEQLKLWDYNSINDWISFWVNDHTETVR